MKLKDWFRAGKEKRRAKKLQRLMPEQEPEAAPELTPELMPLGSDTRAADELDENGQPKSRFTEEYREFLQAQESIAKNSGESIEEN